MSEQYRDMDNITECLKAFDDFQGLDPSAFLEFYYGANERVKAYLRCVIEKSYTLFILHHDNFRAQLKDDIKRTKSDLTRSDLEYIASISSGVYGSDVDKTIDRILHGIRDGMETCIDTFESLLQDWDMPKRPRDILDAECPAVLERWLKEKREQYKGFSVEEPDYYLNNVYTTFLFDNQWYEISGHTLGINLYAFESIADDINKSLDRIGARYIVYHGVLD